MNRCVLAFLTLILAATKTLNARELLCEQCLPEPTCWEHLFVERCQYFGDVEFLYWGIAQGNLDYAIDVDPFPVDSYRNFRIADYHFKPGFRLGLSYYNCPKYWEITTQYTWMHNEGKDIALPKNGFLLFSTRFSVTNLNLIEDNESVVSDLDFDYQLGDLYVARVFDPNAHLRMRVHAGVTLGYLKQKWDTLYNSFTSDSVEYDTQWKFFGGGFRLGITADWFWGTHLYLTGRANFATLYGGYENTQVQDNVSQGVASRVLDRKYDDPRCAFHSQIMMGPSWQIPFDCWSFELFAGYEMNLWFNLSEEMRLVMYPLNASTSALTVLGLHGLNLRLCVGF